MPASGDLISVVSDGSVGGLIFQEEPLGISEPMNMDSRTTSIGASIFSLDNGDEPLVDAEVLRHDISSIEDTDLFKYFLNDENESRDSSSPMSSPHHLANTSSPIMDCPELTPDSSPPQLTPDSPEHHSYQQINNGRKRTATQAAAPVAAPAPSIGTTTKGLSREELLQLSSRGLEAYTQQQTSGKILSPDDERLLKRQKRLIKNRESAQLSRLRKKVYIEELEKKVSQLTTENDTLSKQIAAIATDKKKLHEEVLYLQNIIKQSPALMQIANSHSTLNNSAVAKKPLQPSPKNMKAAGICLLIVLFSFGILFNTNNPNFSFRTDGESSGPKDKNVYTGRLLKSLKEEPADIKLETGAIADKNPSAIATIDSIKGMDSGIGKHPRDASLDRAISIEQHVSEQSTKKRKMKIAEEDSIATSKSFGLVAHDSLHKRAGVTEVALRDGVHEERPIPLGERPNTSYIYCSEAQQMTSTVVTSSAPESIALLIPANLLNATLSPEFDSSLLEVSCQVLNLHMWPMPNGTRHP